MPFPVTIGVLTIPHAAGLGYVVAADLAADGGTVVEGRSVHEWLPEVAEQLDTEEQRALIRGLLLQKNADAISSACAVAMARRVDDIGPYFLSALLHHDVGTLMSPDAWGHPVEELLARTAAELCPLDDPRWRGLVLTNLRSAGLSRDEARVLARYGTASEFREWGPPLLASGDPVVRDALSAASGREEVGEVVAELLGAPGA